MFLRPRRVFRSRICRDLGFAFGLAAAWAAWWVWPQQPELRLRLHVPIYHPSGIVTADGRTLVCDREQKSLFGDPGPRHIDTFELPTGGHHLTVADERGFWLSISPDGSRLAHCDSPGAWHLRALPSQDLICSLPKVDPKELSICWTPDGRYLLFFNAGLAVFRAGNGECVGRFEVEGSTFAFLSDGSGFVALADNRRELLVHFFDSATPDTIVPLPGPPAYDHRQPERRPADGSVSINDLAANGDGSVIFTYFYRHHPDGERDRRRQSLARWDRSTQRWSEVDLGPVAQGTSLESTLLLDVSGRHLATRRMVAVQTGETVDDARGEEEAKQFANKDLWDVSTPVARCLNDKGVPPGYALFDPTGRRILLRQLEYGLHTIYDAETLALLSSQIIRAGWDEPVFSADGRWVAFSESLEPWQPSWLPDRVADRIGGWLRPASDSVRVVRLADGKTVLRLNGRTSPTLTTDGNLWTVTQADRSDDATTLIAERWSPEPPWPPWWLDLITVSGLVAVARDLRRRAPAA